MNASAPQPRFRILVALDDSEYAEVVLEHAIDQAARHDRSDLHFLRVVGSESQAEAARAELATQMLAGLEPLGTSGTDWRSWLHVVTGTAEDEIPNLAGELRADLIVIGRFGVHHRYRSTVERVLTSAPCPTLVVNLKEDEVGDEQCPLCVAVRAASDAERLFCDQHVDDRLVTSRMLDSGTLTRGGSVW